MSGSDRTIIASELLSRVPGLVFGMSTSKGGVSRFPFGMNVSFRVGDREEDVERNRELFLEQLGIRKEELATPGQVHSNKVVFISAAGSYPECDGLMTNVAGLFVGVTVADCVPVMLVDPARRVVAAVHAGWRGTAAEITRSAIGMMKDKCGSDPASILAFLGPSAGVCCYAVGEEVSSQFPPGTIEERDGRIFLDVRKANHLQLIGSGVPLANIEESALCTIMEQGLLHSYRRDGSSSGRMMALMGFRP